MSATLGQRLSRERQAREITLDQVSEATHIRVRYLQALEDGNWDLLPSLVQARGFLRAYANFLDLDMDQLLVEAGSQPKAGGEKPSPRSDKQTPTPSTAQSTQPQPHPAPPSPSLEFSEAAAPMFVEIGGRLRHQRELLGLSLDDVERHTHLKQHYLRALEAGSLEHLPSPVQGRGMLNNYAAFLGLDPEPLLLRFADGLQARLTARQAVVRPQPADKPARPKRSLPSPLRRIFSADILIVGLMAIFLVGFVMWGAIRIFTIQTDQTPTSTAPSIVDILLATPTPSETPTPLPATPTRPALPLGFPTAQQTISAPEGESPAGGAGRVELYLAVLQRAWLQVTVDGKVEFDGRVVPGSAYSFAGETQIDVLTGNGAAFQVIFNQQNLGSLGDFGEVVNTVFTPAGILLPTPTITLTPARIEPILPADQATAPALP